MRSVLLLAALLLAGCAAPATAPAPATVAVQELGARPDTSFGDVATGPAAQPDLNATTAQAPHLVKGEWWRMRFTSGFFTERPEFVRVVADVTPQGYVVGMPHEGWFKEAVVFHVPGFGDINPDLSFDVHNQRFEPLRFPLASGASWTTKFGGDDYTMSVKRADAATAVIEAAPANTGQPGPMDTLLGALSPVAFDGHMRFTYDARQHEVVKFESSFGTWDVVAHGYNFTGWVTVPRGEHTSIDYGQFLAATPGAPVVTRSQLVQGDFNRMTILHAVIAFSPGAYRIRDVSPNGTEYTTESIGAQGFTLKFYESSNPDGKWTMEDVVGGAGATYTMGMAYHQFDIRLPDGAVREDHSHAVNR